MALPANRVELSETAQRNLAAFRGKVTDCHLCKTWKSPEDLKASVFAALIYAFRVNPRVGWIRGDNRDSPETLKKLTLALEQNAQITAELEQVRRERALQGDAGEERFAHGEEEISIRINCWPKSQTSHATSWKWLFLFLAPTMMTKRLESELVDDILGHLYNEPIIAFSDAKSGRMERSAVINIDDWRSIVLQFLALGYWEEAQFAIRDLQSTNQPMTLELPGYKLTPLGVKRFAEATEMHRQPS